MPFGVIRLGRGFTLIELLVVVALVGILAGVGFPIYMVYISSAADADAKNTLRMISVAQEKYKTINGAYFANAQAGPSVASTTEIQQQLLNNLSISTKYYTYSVQTAGCATQPTTGLVRQFCAFAQKTGESTRYTIDHTDAIYDQNNKLQ